MSFFPHLGRDDVTEVDGAAPVEPTQPRHPCEEDQVPVGAVQHGRALRHQARAEVERGLRQRGEGQEAGAVRTEKGAESIRRDSGGI